MHIREHEPVGAKTTMRIGGKARYFAEVSSREDIEAAVAFARAQSLPLIVLGSGSNTIFADGIIHAFVIRITAVHVHVHDDHVTVASGKNLAMLVNEMASQGLDLSPLTGIPGTVGAAVFGNAGQGPKGIWMDTYVESVTAYVDGCWRTFDHHSCCFRYRESAFKDQIRHQPSGIHPPPILWEAVLKIPRARPEAIHAEIQRLLRVRVATQPHLKTAGSCFKAVGDTPAWKLIDAAGFRGARFGDIEIAQKHANFLLNVGRASFADATAAVRTIRSATPTPLEVEMRFIGADGRTMW